ncbi:MAG: nucleotide-binding universal stress UspA family protein [Gammaproteobacteria bacterium]|jgi:nucleotide-binding universal stress UspA family protein
MSHYKQILVAVDFSDPSIRALQVARDLGTRLNAKLIVIHFVPMRIMDMGMEGGVDFIEEMHQSELAEARIKLEKFIKEHTTSDDEIEHHLRSGEPAAEMNSMATEVSADMIIIGTHGRSGIKHLLMGSVAESILRTADVPVLSVRSP